MSGHSKWSQIKRKKEAADTKKGQVFTKLAFSITSAVKEKGEDPKKNLKLRLLLEKTRAANMPKESIERAIKKGLGEAGKESTEAVIYETYGPGDTALLIEVMTDNKNRTTSEIRKILENNKKALSESGGVKWLFKKIGLIKADIGESDLPKEDIELVVIDDGAENIEIKNNLFEITAAPKDIEKIKNSLLNKKVKIVKTALMWLPLNKVDISKNDKENLEFLISEIRRNNDVVGIYHNAR